MSHVVVILQHTTALGPLWVVLLTLVGLPIANDIVQRAKGSSPTSLIAKAQSLLQLIASGALSIPAVGAIIAKFPIVGDILYALAPSDRTALPKPLSKVWLDARAAKKAASNDNKTPPAASPPIAPAALVLFLMASIVLQGCLPSLTVCNTMPVPATLTAKCTLEKNLVSCGYTSGYDLIPIVVDIVLAAAADNFDKDAVLAQIETLGLGTTAPCVIAAVESYLSPVAPTLAAKVHSVLVLKLEKLGKHGVVNVKLKTGYVAHCVLP